MSPHLRLGSVVTSLCIALAAVSSGCSISSEALPDEEVKAICNYYARCGYVRSAQTCYDLYKGSLTKTFSQAQARYEASIAAGRVKYNGGRAKACLDALSGRSCDPSAVPETDENCDRIYEGTLAAGQTCNSGECAYGLTCALPATSSCGGTCKALVAAGGEATRSSECQPGLYFEGGICKAPSDEGQACSPASSDSCKPGLHCQDRVCVKWRIEGQSCSDTQRCYLYLNCLSGVCARPSGVGQACGANDVGCMLDLYCNLDAMVCKEPEAEGGACSSSSYCQGGLICSNGTCAKPSSEGQACVARGCAENLYCEGASKTCKPVVADGAACSTNGSDSPCKSGSLCSGGKCVSLFTTTCP